MLELEVEGQACHVKTAFNFHLHVTIGNEQGCQTS